MSANHECLAALEVAVYTTDAEGSITFFNDAAAELWGFRPELGAKWCGSWKLFHSDGRPLPHDQCPMALTLREGRPVRGWTAILERPDAVRVPFQPFPTPLRDSEGNVTGAINLLVDLRDRQHGEVESARLAAIVSGSDDAIVSKTLDGIVRSWNAGAERIFGYAAHEMIGQPITTLIPPELLSEEKDIVSKLARGERIDHYETVRVAKDGSRVDVSLTVSPLRDASGAVVGASKIARDITEKKRAEQVQRLLLDELNHRIKNTLATVQAIANQTLRRAKNPAEFVTSFNGRIHALARAHTLLTSSSFEGAELSQLVRDQVLMGGAGDRRISCVGPSLMLDSQAALHLALVLHELGTNARKHGALSSTNGAVAVTWEMRANGGRTLHLNWEESGGPKVSAPSGAGFGTTLIEQSLRAHNGEVSLRYSEAGVSCSISLPLPDLSPPFAALRARTSVVAAVPRQDPVDQSLLAGKRILVVEDEAVIGMVLTDYLMEVGCTVVGPAQSLEKALSLIGDAEFDAALLDANINGRPVDELAAALTRKGVPFVFVTGYGRDALPLAFKESPAVEKPFTQEQVLSALERLLGRGDNVVPLTQKTADRDAR